MRCRRNHATDQARPRPTTLEVLTQGDPDGSSWRTFSPDCEPAPNATRPMANIVTRILCMNPDRVRRRVGILRPAHPVLAANERYQTP